MADILFSSLCQPSSRDANAIQIDRMCVAFEKAGHKVVLTAIGARPDVNRSYQLLLVPWATWRFRNRLMQGVTAVCLAYMRPQVMFTRSPLLAMSGLKRRAAIVLELHSLPDSGTQMHAALRRLLTHPSLRRIITISQALADDLSAQFGPPHLGCDIVVAHDGADAGPRLGPAVMHSGPLRVGYFGHLYPGKGMECIAALAQLLPDMTFEVYGGTEADLARWRAACAGQQNLTLFGHIPHMLVSARMADCDILIAPYGPQVSHSGGGDIGRWMSPLKLFEYMAAERPIVTADLPVLREVALDGVTAILCPPGDVAAFAAALRKLAADRALRDRLGSAARDILEAKYTWDQRGHRVLKGIVHDD